MHMSQALNLEKINHASIIFKPVSTFQSITDELVDSLLEGNLISEEYRSSDLLKVSYPSLGMDEAVQIGNFNSRRALGKNKVMIVSTEGISGPAQNALLKIIEEPAPNTFFFFIIPSKSQILPTLLSRFRELSTNHDSHRQQHPTLNAENFVVQPASNRLEIIKEIMAFLDNEKITKGEISEFISDVIKTRYEISKTADKKGEGQSAGAKKLSKQQIKAIVAIEHFMRDASSSIKMSLEYLALNV